MKLYSPADLFGGFDAAVPGSYALTHDARTYHETRVDHSAESGATRALHDHHITVARDAHLAEHRARGRFVVAIMGGHAERRGSEVYRAVADMAQRLAPNFLVASGGGPGAMEATHLGALIRDQNTLQEAIALLEQAAEFPPGMKQLVAQGRFEIDAIHELHRWQVPAFEILDSLPEPTRGESLAIPTWFYGHEPPTPFATHIAKYFHNALREDGLLAVADAGIIYAPGKAGTLQEIFQDAAQNYYESFGRFSPMAFLDVAGYWSEHFPVELILRPLFGDEKYDRWVLISSDPDEVVSFVEAHR
jgi:predicted Rossmann-fold nucleotide-binding protein